MKIYYLKDHDELFPEDCDYIWRYITDKGHPTFQRCQLEDLYREFSTEVYCATFMIPSDTVLNDFVTWLLHKEL